MPRRLTPTDTIMELGRSKLLDDLTGPQLVVYIRILKAAGLAGRSSRGAKVVSPTNADLYSRDASRTVKRALEVLEERSLIKVSFDRAKTRLIAVL